ncbi:MAG: hypothetical protein KatS3mg008_1779 [Acidimicrobiales bacterium]|nr:MAG: hypothetical protein KatS3mg008_1779 [Acidimicrobiales bacterium]
MCDKLVVVEPGGLSWRVRIAFRALVVAATAVVGVDLYGAAVASAAATGAPGTDPEKVKCEEDGGDLLRPGRPVEVGPLTVVVGEPVPVDDEGGLVKIPFEVENRSSSPVSLSQAVRWQLTSGSVVVEPSSDHPASLSVGLVEDGVTREGTLVFSTGGLPREAVLLLDASFAGEGSRTARWAVTLPERTAASPAERVPFEVPEGVEAVRSYKIDVQIDRDGEAEFDEKIVYDFGGEVRHGIYREYIVRVRCDERYDRVWPFEMISVDSPDAPDQVSVEDVGDRKRLRIGDPDLTVTGRHDYRVRVRMRGVVNPFPEHDEFFWNAVGHEWSVPILGVTVTVRGPAEATDVICFAGPFGSGDPCESKRLRDGVAEFAHSALMPGSGLTVGVKWPKGVFSDPRPILEERWSFERAFSLTPVTLAASLAGGLALLGGWLVFAYRTGRDRVAVGSPTDVAFATVDARSVPVPFFADDDSPVEFAPPEGIRPAQMGVLMYERVRPVDLAATLVDLAVRGHLMITEEGSRWRTDYVLTRRDEGRDDLLDYESAFLAAVFKDSRREERLSKLKGRFHRDHLRIKEMIYEDATRRGWFAGRPDRVRTKWKAIALVILLVGLGLTYVLARYTTLGLLGIPVVVLGLVVSVSAPRLPRRTPAGVGLLRRCSGFQSFIVDSEAPRARWAEQRNIFSEYLPYAIVLGESEKWAKTFEGLGPEAVGDVPWYRGDRPLSPSYLASEMRSFSARAGSTLAFTPPGGGGVGRSGFSGGFSGGGGGGGGGGSW